MNVEDSLKKIHAHVCRVAFLVGVMLLNRKLSKERLEESKTRLKEAIHELDNIPIK